MATPLFPALTYKHRGLAADQHLTQEEWNQVGVEVQALEDFHEAFLVTCAIGRDEASVPAGTTHMGGFMVPRTMLDARMPNARWYASGYFWASAPAGTATTIELVYTNDAAVSTVLGSVAMATGSQTTNVKRSVEPVEITQYMETVICVRLRWVITGTALLVPGAATVVLTGKRRTANDQ